MKFIAIIIAPFMSACASTEYAQYTTTQQAIAASKAQADTARYQALAQIASTGTDSARVAAVMALAIGGSGQTQAPQIVAPQPSQVLQWASLIVPVVTQAYAIGKNADVAIASSSNAMQTSIATTAGFVGIASKIQAPAAATVVTPQANISTVTTTTSTDTSTTTGDSMSGTGVQGSGSYSTQANPVTTTTPAGVAQ